LYHKKFYVIHEIQPALYKSQNKGINIVDLFCFTTKVRRDFMTKASLKECIDEIKFHRHKLLRFQANLNAVMTIMDLIGGRNKRNDKSLQITLEETKASLRESKVFLRAFKNSEEFVVTIKNAKQLYAYLEQYSKNKNNCYPYEYLDFVYNRLVFQKSSEIKDRMARRLQSIRVKSDFDTTESLTRVHSIVSECCSIANITLLFLNKIKNSKKAALKVV